MLSDRLYAPIIQAAKDFYGERLYEIQAWRDFELRNWTADEMEKLEAEITRLEQEAVSLRVAPAKSFTTYRIMNIRFMPLPEKKSNGKKKAKTHRKTKQARKGTPRRRQSSRSRRKGRV